MKRKDEIIVWDDLNFFLSKPDSLERIVEDAIKLTEKYIELKQEHQLTSIYSVFYHYHLDTMFLIGILRIIDRVGRLKK